MTLRRRWMQLSLRTLLIVILALSLAAAYVTHERRRIATFKRDSAALTEKGMFLGSSQSQWSRAIFGHDLRQETGYIGSSDLLTDQDIGQLANFSAIETLNIDCRELSNAAGKYMGRLHGLRSLTLRNAYHLDDDMFRELKACRRIKDFKVTSAAISDAGLSVLSSMTELESAMIVDCDINDAAIAPLAALPRLHKIGLRGPLLTNAVFEPFKKLEEVVLEGRQFDNRVCQTLIDAQVELLTLTRVSFSDAGMAALARGHFVELKLHSVPITDVGLNHLANTSLQSLTLEDTDVTDAGLMTLSSLPQLIQLFLIGDQFTDAALPHLDSLKSLQVLNVNLTRITSAGQTHLRKKLPACRFLLIAKYVQTKSPTLPAGSP